MVYQYLRKCSLIVSDGSDGIELSEMHIRFTVYHATIQTPNTLQARVYNLSPATMNRICKEYTQVYLKAGYSNWSGEIFDTIFAGYIIWAKKGRESPTDTYLEINAADGDFGYTYAKMTGSLAAGHTNKDIKKMVDRSFKELKVDKGHEAEMPETKYPRGRVLYGMTRDIARNLAQTTGHTWSIQEGKYTTVKLDSVLPDEEIVLRADTGLIGMPQQTADGVIAKSLLSPYLVPNRKVFIDNKSVQTFAFPSPPTGDSMVQFWKESTAAQSADGHYKVLAVDHTGDTRGNQWYSDMWLIMLNGPRPTSDTSLQMQVGPEGPPQPQPILTTEPGNANIKAQPQTSNKPINLAPGAR